MKKITLFVVLLFFITAYGQKVEVPQKVQAAFDNKYPEAEDISWIKRTDNYEAEFLYNDELKAALFDVNGKWLQTSTTISEDELPDNALNDIIEIYENGFINDAAKVIDNNGQTFYKVSVYTDQATYYLKIDNNGEIIETSKELNPEEDYDLDIDESEYDYNEG